MVVDLIIICLTCIMYLLANGFTYHIGTTTQCCNEPLFDILHDILPNLSSHIQLRDVLLLLSWIPILLIEKKIGFLSDFLNAFMVVVFIKAVLIFFTFMPPSNQACKDNHHINHCYHNAVSGHVSMVCLLMCLYSRCGSLNQSLSIILTLLYGLFTIATRAHYTKDVIEAIIICSLVSAI